MCFRLLLIDRLLVARKDLLQVKGNKCVDCKKIYSCVFYLRYSLHFSFKNEDLKCDFKIIHFEKLLPITFLMILLSLDCPV